MSRKIVFTSTLNGSGKTCLITLLAREYASSGSQVLIIDNSFRISRLPRMFGFPRFERTLDELIPLTTMQNFTYQTILPFINQVDDNIDIIGCSRVDIVDPTTMSTIVNLIDFYGDYDYILVEAPPMYKMSDAFIIFVLDGRLDDCKPLTSAGEYCIINKYDPNGKKSLKKLPKNVIVLSYESGMVGYETLTRYVFSDYFMEKLYDFINVIEEKTASSSKQKEILEDEFEDEPVTSSKQKTFFSRSKKMSLGRENKE